VSIDYSKSDSGSGPDTSKGGVSLTKGQTVSLVKKGGGGLSKVRLGLGWDAGSRKTMFGGTKQRAVDLDASCLMYGADGKLLDNVWFRQLRSKDGSVQHTGDDRRGGVEGDAESIRVDLTQVPAAVQTLVFVVNSYSGENFSQIQRAHCRVVDETSGDAELVRYDLTETGNHTASVMAKVARASAGWVFTAIGATGSGKTIRDMEPLVRPHL
jgi:tellurium resistance protein TerZ